MTDTPQRQAPLTPERQIEALKADIESLKQAAEVRRLDKASRATIHVCGTNGEPCRGVLSHEEVERLASLNVTPVRTAFGYGRYQGHRQTRDKYERFLAVADERVKLYQARAKSAEGELRSANERIDALQRERDALQVMRETNVRLREERDALREKLERREATYTKPNEGWVCFHCGERFLSYSAAKEHFGETPHTVESMRQERDAAISSRDVVKASLNAQAERLRQLEAEIERLTNLGPGVYIDEANHDQLKARLISFADSHAKLLIEDIPLRQRLKQLEAMKKRAESLKDLICEAHQVWPHGPRRLFDYILEGATESGTP